MNNQLKIGWASADITPQETVLVQGQFHARVSEGITDALFATALALDNGETSVVLVGCDVISISDDLLIAVRDRLPPEISPEGVILSATHTHAGPGLSTGRYGENSGSTKGVDLPVQPVSETVSFIAERIAGAIKEAWQKRSPGSVAFGLGRAMVARNRRWVDLDGASKMYGSVAHETFSHVEGYEDHDLNILATYAPDGTLTGLLLNTASPSQVREQDYCLSADYWHETRQELKKRLGNDLHILPQCAPAGDQSPYRIRKHIYNRPAEDRMLNLKQRSPCEEIAHRIANSVEEVLPLIHSTRESSPKFQHRRVILPLPFNPIDPETAEAARKEGAEYQRVYEEKLKELEANPSIREQPRWYYDISKAYALMRRQQRVAERYESIKTQPEWPVELHFLRVSDMAMGTNPFEYYLDYAIQIKARSPAVQNFLVQLCGPGFYVPSRRSLKGGGYGSVPASNTFGPEAGDILRERTLEEFEALWEGDGTSPDGGPAKA